MYGQKVGRWDGGRGDTMGCITDRNGSLQMLAIGFACMLHDLTAHSSRICHVTSLTSDFALNQGAALRFSAGTLLAHYMLL